VSLTAADVAEIMRLLEQSSFDELTLEMEGIKLSLRRGAAAERADVAAVPSSAVASAPTLSPAPMPAPAITQTPTSAPATPGRSVAADPNIQDVVAPLLGTFYRSPKPGAPPFVEVGATVTEDSVVAIIEVMKLMNTVRAGARGTVVEILPVDGALVEYGEPLLRVRKSG
jgi:acetyl-CoA carboxylase biotin carboxyl carrier protein